MWLAQMLKAEQSCIPGHLTYVLVFSPSSAKSGGSGTPENFTSYILVYYTEKHLIFTRLLLKYFRVRFFQLIFTI